MAHQGHAREALPRPAAGLQPYVARAHARWAQAPPERGWHLLDGSLVLLDISGFTALSERLQGLGRAGAEVLTGLINEVFTAVLATAPELGGDVLRFGGDAALVLFDGPGHPARAARLAGDMRGALLGFARVSTEAGDAKISGSIGVASGDVVLHVAGESHRELIVFGAAAREVVRLEAAAQPGQILVSEATAAALPAGAVVDGALGEQPVAVALSSPAPQPMPPDGVRRALPIDVRAHLDQTAGAPDFEHRRVPVGFVRATLGEALREPGREDARQEAIERVIRAAQAACARYETTFLACDLDLDAFKIIITAGAPISVEHADERLALALTAVVDASREELRVRAGAHRGPLFAADVGAPHRRAWTLMGDTVNLAARVMGRAPDGEVLVTSELAGRLPSPFGRRPIAPFAAKGKSEPVQAELLDPPAGLSAAAVAGREGLVGRETELAMLTQRLTDAAAGTGSALALVGPAGIGKSRLLQALAGGHDGTRLVIEGGLYGRHTPYLALHEPLRALLGLSRVDPGPAELERFMAATHPALAPWTPLLGSVLGIAVPDTPTTEALRPEFRRARLHAVVGDILEHRLSADGPGALLIVDESQWLDEPSRELLGVLADRAAGRGWMLIEAIREVTEDVSRLLARDAAVHLLAPIGQQAAQSIIEDLLVARGIGVLPLVRRQLVELGSGNPLFLQELARTIGREGVLEEMPASLEELIAGRIDRLPAARRRFVRQVAVLGMRFAPSLAADLLDLGVDDAVDQLRDLEDLFQFEGPDRVVFRHGLLRDVAYQALPFARRRELHARAGRLLEEDSGLEADALAQLLSTHFHEARDHAASWRWSRTAGQGALAAASPLDAIVFLERAVSAGRVLRDLPRREVSELFETLGDAYERAGRYEDAGRAYARARRFASGAALTSARLCLKSGILFDRTGNYPAGRSWFTKGEKVLAASDVTGKDALSMQARLGRVQGAFLLRQGKPAAALRRLEPAKQAALDSGDRATLANIYYLLAWGTFEVGDPRFEEYRDAARPIYEELGDDYGLATALNNLGADAYHDGDWDEALSYYSKSAEARERAGDVVHLGYTHYNVAEVLIQQGHFEAAAREIARARAVFGEGYALGNAACDLLDGLMLVLGGDPDGAAAPLGDALQMLDELGATTVLLEARLVEIARRVAMGDRDAARRVLAQVVSDTGDSGPLERTRIARATAQVQQVCGATDAALAAAREALAAAVEAHAPYEELLALVAALDAAPGDADAPAWRERVEALRTRLHIVRPL